jgi:hypothetical protein
MTAAIPDDVVALLQESLAAWCEPGVISRKPDGGLELRADGILIQIARAPAGLPFRWLVGVGELRRRPVSGLPGLLRAVRAALDPNFRPLPVRIAALPLAP